MTHYIKVHLLRKNDRFKWRYYSIQVDYSRAPWSHSGQSSVYDVIMSHLFSADSDHVVHPGFLASMHNYENHFKKFHEFKEKEESKKAHESL